MPLFSVVVWQFESGVIYKVYNFVSTAILKLLWVSAASGMLLMLFSCREKLNSRSESFVRQIPL
jgi:hypothetical protein